MAVSIEALYLRYGAAVHRKCYRMVGSWSDADDLTQEVFLRAMKALSRFEGEGGHLAWLYRIATNTCLSALRRAQRPLCFDDVVIHPPEDAAPLPDETIHNASILQQAFGELEPLTQQIVVAYFLDDMSQVEIAELYQVTRRTVFNHLARFRRALLRLREAG